MTMRDYSVVIPAFNAASTIAETLESVMGQSIPPSRVYVIDDGSTDGTLAAIAGFGRGVEAISQPNAGPGAATTRGLRLVMTPFVATVDADDIWLPGKIECQFEYLLADDAIAAVFTKLANFKGEPAAAEIDDAYDGWTRSTMLIRATVARAGGTMIDLAGRAGEMVDWLARLRDAGHRLEMIQQVLALRRVHAGSLTDRPHAELGRAYLQVARSAMLRRRKAHDGGNQ